MATQPLSNLIDPPPRLTGDSARDTVSVIQWLSAFYTKGILSGALLQPQNMARALISLGALPGAADMLAYYTAEDTFDLTGFTAFARTLLEAVDADEARTTLGAGDVVGPASSTNNHVAVFDGITGKLLKDGGAPAGDVVGPAGAVDGNVVLFDTATGKLVKDGGTLGSAAFTSSAAYDPAGAAAAAQAASQPADADLTTWAGITPGANVGTALAVAVGTDGAFVVKGGALGTPSSGTVTNLTGTASININGTVGATTLNTVAGTSGTFGANGIAIIRQDGSGDAEVGGAAGANQLRFLVNNVDYARLTTGAFSPETASGLTLGTAALPWGSFWSSDQVTLTKGGSATPSVSNSALVFDSSSTAANYAGMWFRGSTSYNTFFGRVPTALSGVNDGVALMNDNPSLMQLWTGAGTSITGAISASTTIRPGGYTVGTLPAGTVGQKAYVTDALAPANLVLLAAGGAAYSGAQFDGAQWVGD